MRKINRYILIASMVLLLPLSFISCGCSKENRDVDDVKQTEEVINTEEVESTGNTDGGGNEFVAASGVAQNEINILIDEDVYIYDNSVITLEDFVTEIEKKNGDVIVKITEHNATKNAYKELTDILADNEIEYISE